MSSVDKLIISPVLVGRAREVERLQNALRAAQGGAGQVLLLTGEAGVGKSRLVDEMRRMAAAMRFTILEGHCFERDLDFPYAPIIDALRAFLAPRTAAVVAQEVGALATELVKLLPELTLVIPSLQPSATLNPEAEKRRLFETLLQFFTKLTQGQETHPLLLIFEDLHWGDETTLDFLHLLARRISSLPICLVATYRSEEISPNLRQLLNHLERERLAHEIGLQPLRRSDVELMVRSIFELKQPVREEFLEVIYSLTEGNPFFMEEVLKSLIAVGDIFYVGGIWDRKPLPELQIPRSVQDAVQRRTEQLSTATHQLLRVAAVMGQRFDFALLQHLAGDDEAKVLAMLKELMAAQLVVEESADNFRFRHALTRQAVYAAMMVRERRILHRAIAEANEQLYGDQVDAHVANLAHHFYEAGEWAKVLVYAQRAAEQAQAMYAPRAAIEHFSRALAAIQKVAQKPSDHQLVAFYRGRGLAYSHLGEFEEARTDLERALAAAKGDRLAEWQALLDLGMLWASRDYAQTGEYIRRALEVARLLDYASIIAQTLNRMGNWYMNIEKMDEALRYHHEALEIFQKLEHHQGIAQTSDLLGMANLIGGDAVQGVAYFQQAITLFQELNDPEGMASPLGTLPICGTSYTTDTVVSASLTAAERLAYGDRARQIAVEIGWRAGEAYGWLGNSYSWIIYGEYGRALEAVQRGVAIAEEIEHRQWMTHGHRHWGAIYMDLFALPQARHHFERALALAEQIGSTIHKLGTVGHLISLLVLEQNFAQAEALASSLDPLLPKRTMGQRRCWQARAELALAQGNLELALQIIDQLVASAANITSSGIGAIPYLAKLQAEALVRLERWEEAEATLLAALAIARQQASPRLLWRLHAALGNLYQAQARRDDAAHAFAAAGEIVDVIAATLPGPDLHDNFLRQTAALIPSRLSHSMFSEPAITNSPRSLALPSSPPAQPPAGLTSREVEVLRLVVQGATNRQIAATLHISDRTVNTHLTHILNKIGCDNRTAAAAFALQHGLV